MRESTVCTEIVNSFKAQNCWSYKIVDPTFAEIKFGTSKRPFDIITFIEEFGLAIEVKLMKKWAKFSPTMFKEHQFWHLDQITKKGGLAYVFLNIRIKEEKINRLLIFEWNKWGEVIKKTGLSKQRLAELHYCQGSKGLFNLYTFVKEFKEIGYTDINTDTAIL